MNLHSAPSRGRGFTLIELLVGLAILAIIGALAYPSLMASIYKSRRSDGIAGIVRVQQAQERWRSSNATYSASLSDLGMPSTSPDGRYTLSIDGAVTAKQFRITATATGSQANDTKCKILFVTQTGGTPVYGSSDGSAEVTGNSPCWSR
ncbi:type IV pilin protein [Aquabacterium sp.]|uniref:type IV pilin protein n=1 Tax=Aquabacterium sp. TaxID=1872578 RepID=UPI00378523FD